MQIYTPFIYCQTPLSLLYSYSCVDIHLLIVPWIAPQGHWFIELLNWIEHSGLSAQQQMSSAASREVNNENKVNLWLSWSKCGNRFLHLNVTEGKCHDWHAEVEKVISATFLMESSCWQVSNQQIRSNFMRWRHWSTVTLEKTQTSSVPQPPVNVRIFNGASTQSFGTTHQNR